MVIPIGSMYTIYGNMDPINISQMLAYIPAPWILWDLQRFILCCRAAYEFLQVCVRDDREVRDESCRSFTQSLDMKP